MKYFFLQIIIGIDLIAAQSESITYRSVKENATIVGVEPFYNQTTFSITECYLICHLQIDKCFFVEVANVNEAWSCRLFHFNTTQDIEKHFRLSKVSGVSVPKLPKDCAELKQLGLKDGVYTISFEGSTKKVFCDMTTDGGGWIVMQRRFDGSVDFNSSWNNYKNGFGDVYGEHWIGNEFVYQYTNIYSTEMIVEGTGFDGKRVSAKMENFALGDEVFKYVLEYNVCIGLADTFNGCYDWDYHRYLKFTNIDNDNDWQVWENCGKQYIGGWWLKSCFAVVNLNGKYSGVPTVSEQAAGIHWKLFRTFYESLKETKILLRRTLWQRFERRNNPSREMDFWTKPKCFWSEWRKQSPHPWGWMCS